MTAVDWRRTAADELLPLLGLAGFGYALPLLDLLGTNPEFLVAHALTGRALVVAALAIATLPPLSAVVSVIAATAVSARAGRVLWCGWVVAFGAMATASLLRPIDPPTDVLPVVLAGLGGVGALWALRHWRAARLAGSLLAVTPLFAVVALAAWSPSSDLVWKPDPGAIEGVTVAHPAPVVVLQLDELPLASLLRADGSLNTDRFPNFGRLAAESTWYADAVAVAPSTTASVPAAVTGNVPVEGELPTAIDHPDNLFTLLGGSYDLQVDEPVTELCPQSLCAGSVDWGGLGNDAVGVAGQLWLPRGLRDRLPAEVRTVADFDDVDALGGDSAAQRQDRARAGIDRIEAGGDRPLLWYEHVVLPHVPWSLTPSGAEYRTNPEFSSGPTDDGAWGDDPVRARLGLQRHLLQVGATDALLGRLIDRLQDQGLWDEAMVVVLADHGAAFDPGHPYRRPDADTAHEIYRVPLFVKQPGQTTGDTRLDLAYNIDVLPTIMEVLGIDVGWDLDGRSILRPVAGRPPDAALYVADLGDAIHPDITFDQVVAVARRNAGLLPGGASWHAVAAAGPLGHLVGTNVSDLTVAGTSPIAWRLDQSADLQVVDTDTTGTVPAFVWGTVTGEDAPADVLLVLDGTVAGTLSRLAGGDTYAGVLDEALIHQGANDIEVLVPTTEDAAAFATATPATP